MKAKNNLVFLVCSILFLSRRPFQGKRNQSFLRPRVWPFLPSALAIPMLLLATASSSVAGSATWKANPATGNWSTGSNWTPATAPNGPNDTATFATSNVRFVVPEGATQVNGIVFKPGASRFTIAPLLTTLTISGTGITNNSGIVQNFAPGPGAINFANNATAGGSNVAFADKGSINFSNTSTAGNATFTSSAGGVTFLDTSTAGDAIFINDSGLILFQDSSTAGNGTFTNNGGLVQFSDGTPTAGNATFINNSDGFTTFNAGSTAGNATVITNGATSSDAFEGENLFEGDAGNATLIANGGSNGGSGGFIQYRLGCTGRTARVEVFSNGTLDISEHNAPGVTTGSIEGSGLVFLGARNLTVGTNNLNTNFSGLIQDGGIHGGTGGSLSKTGSGRLTLSKASTYTGGTTVRKGTLLVTNRTGSATGSGPVQVNAGTLGGTGKVSGVVTIGAGATAAVLSPGSGATLGTLTTLRTLTFNSLATYKVDLNSTSAKADKTVALGVTINSGARFSLDDLSSGVLTTGKVFTVINNTAATPIAGTFSNLPDSSTLTVGRNNYQVSYEGGDGNDLTLTVVR
jgi:autotransporter-associated beta strand protein